MTPRCPHCAQENRPERRYCGACGGSLDHACPACGFANGPTDRYCGGCGARLGGRQATARTAGRMADRGVVSRPTLPTLEVLVTDGGMAAITYDDLPPVDMDADDTPLDSGEFRELFET